MYNKRELESIYLKLSKSLSNGIVAFSIKSNYFPTVIKDLIKLDSWFEVSSEEEFDYLLSLSVEAEKVVINAPISSLNFIKRAVSYGAHFNVQNLRQWNLCKKLGNNSNETIKIGFRLNIGYNSRFGLSSDSLEKITLELENYNNIEVESLHVHVCEEARSPKDYEDKFDAILEYSAKFSSLKYLNIGGGFYSEMPQFLQNQFTQKIPLIDDYIEVLKGIEKKTNLSTIIEPGALLVANCLSFYTKVQSIDKLNNEYYIQVDGSIYDIMPTKSKKQLPYKVYSDSISKIKGKVVGFTCMEDDVLVNEFHASVNLEDWICFSNVGSYALTLRPSFISPAKPIISFENEELVIHRSKADFKKMFEQWT